MQHKMVAFSFAVLAGLALVLPCLAEKGKSKKADGKTIFAQHCEKCHAGGGNQVKPSLPLAGSSQLSSIVVFKAYLTKPPGHMPYYADVVNDRATLQALYDYCKSLKKPASEKA